MMDSYNIGKLSKKLNINKETIRYYEKLQLLPMPKRDINGYRKYTDWDLQKLRLILRAKEYGFSLSEIKFLLIKLFQEIEGCDITEIKAIVENKIEDIDKKLIELKETKKLLVKLNNTMLSDTAECCDLNKL